MASISMIRLCCVAFISTQARLVPCATYSGIQVLSRIVQAGFKNVRYGNATVSI